MGKFNHSRAGSSTTNSCRCEVIEKKLNEAKKKLKKVFDKLDKLKKAAVKKIAKKVATLPLKAVPILGWAMAAYDVYDVVTTGIDIADVVEEFNKEAGIVNKLSDKLDACLGKKKVKNLTPKQVANLKRFEKKLPKGANPTIVKHLPNGNKVFKAEVPGRVPGSSAVYEKTVDATTGNTVKYIKTTYLPDGSIAHVKQKYP